MKIPEFIERVLPAMGGKVTAAQVKLMIKVLNEYTGGAVKSAIRKIGVTSAVSE